MKTVFITDTRDRRAFEAAKYLLASGYKVVCAGKGDIPDGCERLSTALTDMASLRAAFEKSGELAGVIIAAPPALAVSVEDATEEQWLDAFNSGAAVAMAVTNVCGNIMAENGRGAIICLGTIHAEKPGGFSPLSSMSASAVQMLCKEAALDFGARGVHSVYIKCGPSECDPPVNPPYGNVYSNPAARYPSKSLPAADSLCGLIGFLLTDAAAPLNGASLDADGGYTLYYGNQKKGDDHDR